MLAITSLKLSRSIWMNLRSFSGLSGSVGIAGEVAQHADDERQLLLDARPFGLHLVGDVDPRFADPRQLVMDARG